MRDLTGGRGADVVFDPVGGAMFEASLRSIAWEGRIVVVGFASGTVPQIPANILLVKNAAVLGFYWGSYRKHDPERLRAGFADLFRWHRGGPHPPARLPSPAAQRSGRGRAAADLAAEHRQGGADGRLRRAAYARTTPGAPRRAVAAAWRTASVAWAVRSQVNSRARAKPRSRIPAASSGSIRMRAMASAIAWGL